MATTENKNAAEIELQNLGEPQILDMETNNRNGYVCIVVTDNNDEKVIDVNVDEDDFYKKIVTHQLEIIKMNNYVKLKKQKMILQNEQNLLLRELIETIKFLPTMQISGSEMNKAKVQFENMADSIQNVSESHESPKSLEHQ